MHRPIILSILTSPIRDSNFRKDSIGSLTDRSTKQFFRLCGNEIRADLTRSKSLFPVSLCSLLLGNYTSWINQHSILLGFQAISCRKTLLGINKYVCCILAGNHKGILTSFPCVHCNAETKIVWSKYLHVPYYWTEMNEGLSDNFSLFESSHKIPYPIRVVKL